MTQQKRSTDEPNGNQASHHLRSVKPGREASYSLGQLEQDLEHLREKWHSVERDMADRDEQIAGLKTRLSDLETQKEQLEEQISEVSAAKNRLAKDLDARMADIGELKSAADQHDHELKLRQAEIETVRHEHAALRGEKEQLEIDLARQIAATSSESKQLSVLRRENDNLNLQVQDLRLYIDGRRGDWDTMKTKVRDYEDALEGMSKSLDAHDRVVAVKEDEKESLARRIVELDRELAEVRGSHAERETIIAAQKAELDGQSRELGRINAETSRLKTDIDKLQARLEQKDETLAGLKQDVDQHRAQHAALKDELAAEKIAGAENLANLESANRRIGELEQRRKESGATDDELRATIGELQERLRVAEPTNETYESRIVELEAKLEEKDELRSALQAEVVAAATNLERLNERATEFEIKATELEAVLLETRSQKESLEQELESQRELVSVLESDLGDKQKNLDMLDRNVELLSSIGSGIREIDVKIDDHWSGSASESHVVSEEQFDAADDVLLAPEEIFTEAAVKAAERFIVAYDDEHPEPIHYPLTQKETTIGRSRKSDIRIKSKYISRIHARINIDGNRVTIEDAGSTNGFIVNAKPVTSHTLSHGDRVRIGKSKLKYLETGDA